MRTIIEEWLAFLSEWKYIPLRLLFRSGRKKLGFGSRKVAKAGLSPIANLPSTTQTVSY